MIMKILHTVELYHPSKGGMQEAVKQISENLVKKGHKVTVATSKAAGRESKSINGVNIEEFEVTGNLVRGMDGDVKKYQDYLLNSGFDIITNFAAQQWTVDATFEIIEKIKARKVFVPTGFSGLYMPEYRKYFKHMKEYMKKYDMNVFLSNDYRDINFARENNIRNIIVIPNGASEEEFLNNHSIDIRKKLNIAENAFLIFHVGSHTTVKGHKEAIEIFNKANIKNSVFLLVGNNANRKCTYTCKINAIKSNLRNYFLKNNKKIIVTSLKREETVAAYKEANLFLFPSNIECSPIVFFECMASKTPFLATDVGNASEIIGWSGGGILLPTDKSGEGYSIAKIDESAQILEQLFFNKEKRKEMADKAFNIWKEKFTWEKIAEQYEHMYSGLLD